MEELDNHKKKHHEMDKGEKYEVNEYNFTYTVCWLGDHKCLHKVEDDDL